MIAQTLIMLMPGVKPFVEGVRFVIDVEYVVKSSILVQAAKIIVS